MEIPCKKQMKSPKRTTAEFDPPDNWAVDDIKLEPVEMELANVKHESDEPGTNNERLQAYFPPQFPSIKQECFVVDGVVVESVWSDEIEIGEVKIQPAYESDDSCDNKPNCEFSSDLSDDHDGKGKEDQLDAGIGTSGILPEKRRKQLENNQQKYQQVRRSVRMQKVSPEKSLRNAPVSQNRIGSKVSIGRKARTQQAKSAKEPVVNAKKEYRCAECNLTYKTRMNFKMHNVLHHRELEDNPIYACSECDKTYPHLELLKRHQVVHKRKLCPECGIKVAYHAFKQHLINHKPNPPRFPCELCSNSYKTARYLREHIAVKHTTYDPHCKTYVCGECDKEFGNRIQFKIHRRNHQLLIRVPCKFCDKSYSRKWMTVHVATHHANNANVSYKAFNCQRCEQPFIPC